MKILALAGAYPHPSHPFSGIFNKKCVCALAQLGHRITVIAPRPFAPPLLSHVPRWRIYSCIPSYESQGDMPVYRPATPVFPRIASALWVDWVAYLRCRPVARRLHGRNPFDAILSFDLAETGGIAWRLGRALGIPAAGWAFGDDVRWPRDTSLGGVVARAVANLDLVFYQSHELRKLAAALVGLSEEQLDPQRHVVLPHGITDPPALVRGETRRKVRKAIGIDDEKVMVLYVGRMKQEKGIFELAKAMTLVASRDSRVFCVMVGCLPGFDQTSCLSEYIAEEGIQNRVRLLPACPPEQVWDYMCAADIFAFPSHREGMPNSLLEAMAMGLPAVAFGIPSILEISAGTDALISIPPYKVTEFAEAIIRLAASPREREFIGRSGKEQVLRRFMMRNNMKIAVYRIAAMKSEKDSRKK